MNKLRNQRRLEKHSQNKPRLTDASPIRIVEMQMPRLGRTTANERPTKIKESCVEASAEGQRSTAERMSRWIDLLSFSCLFFWWTREKEKSPGEKRKNRTEKEKKVGPKEPDRRSQNY